MNQAMLDYQKVDSQLKKLENDLHNSEERKRTMAAKKFLLDGEDVATRTDEKAVELLSAFHKLKEAQAEQAKIIDEYEAAMSESGEDPDELAYLAKKINQVLDTLKMIENDLGRVVKEMEELSKSFRDFRKKFQKSKDDYKTYKQKYDELKLSKQEEMAKLKQELSKIAKKIEPDLLEVYQQKRTEKIFPVLVPLNGDMCGGCSMELSLKEKDELHRKGFYECEHCKKLIYVP